MGQPSGDYVAARRAKDKVRRGAGGLAGLIWPQRSLITHGEVPGPGALEPNLWAKLQFLSDPVCVRCGTPFEIAVDPGQVCGACLANPPVYDRARAALIYGDVSRDLVLSLKYQGRRDGLFVLGGWMANAGKDLLAGADLIVPVPLHYIRLVRRGFNQSAWLAAELSRQGGVKLSVDALKRVKRTPHPGRPLRRRPAAECPGRIPCPEVPGETGEGSENLAGR